MYWALTTASTAKPLVQVSAAFVVGLSGLEMTQSRPTAENRQARDQSSDGGILLEGDGAKLVLASDVLAEVAAWRVDLDLPDVRVAPVLVIGQDGHLDKVRAQRLLGLTAALGGLRAALAGREDGDPSARLVELLHVDLLQVMEGRAHADRDLRRRVALVQLEVGVDDNLMDAHWKGDTRAREQQQPQQQQSVGGGWASAARAANGGDEGREWAEEKMTQSQQDTKGMKGRGPRRLRFGAHSSCGTGC